jgi:hypothetical protein
MEINDTYNTQNKLLLNNIIQYFRKNNNIDKILPILNGESQISIRIIDWFVTNYAKEHFTIYNIEKNGLSKRFKVYIDYKLKLKSYSKKRFDPFCRWDRINLSLDVFNNKSIENEEPIYIQTTVGQLNFFRWALDNNILEYVKKNINDIENDMNSRNLKKKNKTQKNKNVLIKTNHLDNISEKTRKKREELSISAIKSIKKENIEVIVRFN